MIKKCKNYDRKAKKIIICISKTALQVKFKVWQKPCLVCKNLQNIKNILRKSVWILKIWHK